MIRMPSRSPKFKIKPWGFALLAVLCLWCLSGNRIQAATEPRLVFETEGQSTVKKENYVRGRALAVEYAFQNALEMALREVLGSRTFKRKKRVLGRMLKRPKRYIKRYRFLETYDSDVEKFSRVKMEVVFYPEAINRELSRLGILASLVKPNTALVLISEKSFSVEDPPDFWDYVPIAEVAMLQKFLAAGVNVTTREQLAGLIDERKVYDAIQGNLDAAIDIGLKAKVDIVIVGTAVTTRLGEKNAEGLTSVQANLTLRAVSTTLSTVIAARSDFASVQAEEEFKGELEAFEVVGKKMAGFFLDTMKRFWKPKPEAGIETDSSAPSGESPPPPSDSTPSMMEDL